ncbi:MAG: response regulator [Myxococcales bacterium]|nr:response regulator [Myxococcales bacterium]MDD9971276.1 response regulator [Myxococcales bacterium]
MGDSKTEHKTVLIADDDLEILGIIRSILRAKNVTIVEATDGDEAMQQVLEHQPQLVVLDVMMPGQSGWEVCKSIREHDATKDTKVVMLTGIGERMNEMTSPLYGADAHMNKPFDMDELSALLDRLLSEV